MDTKKIIQEGGWIIIAVVGWRLLLSLVLSLAIHLPYQPSFPYAQSLHVQYPSRYISTWVQFDGVHYLTLLHEGYKGAALIQAFFPLYPLLTKMFTFGFFDPVIVGIVLSPVCFGAGLLLLYRLLQIDESKTTAARTVWLILLSPVSFYFAALYTEGLFFLLVVLSFYFARTQRWLGAGIIAMLASATRVVGILLLPALLYEFWQQQKQISWKHASAFFPLVGLGAYMTYLQIVFHDAFLFFKVQQSFGTQRSTDKFILLYQVFFRYVKMLVTVPWRQEIYYVVCQEFMAGLLGLIGLIVGWFTSRRSYLVFCIGAYLVPTLTGTFSSLPRYLLPLFPVFLIPAKYMPRWAYIIILLISFGLLLVNFTLFAQGHWIA